MMMEHSSPLMITDLGFGVIRHGYYPYLPWFPFLAGLLASNRRSRLQTDSNQVFLEFFLAFVSFVYFVVPSAD